MKKLLNWHKNLAETFMIKTGMNAYKLAWFSWVKGLVMGILLTLLLCCCKFQQNNMKLFSKIFLFALHIAPWVLVIIMSLIVVGLVTMCLNNPTFEYVETSYPFGKPKLK